MAVYEAVLAYPAGEYASEHMLSQALPGKLVLLGHIGALAQQLRKGPVHLAVLVLLKGGLLHRGQHPLGELPHGAALAVGHIGAQGYPPDEGRQQVDPGADEQRGQGRQVDAHGREQGAAPDTRAHTLKGHDGAAAGHQLAVLEAVAHLFGPGAGEQGAAAGGIVDHGEGPAVP